MKSQIKNKKKMILFPISLIYGLFIGGGLILVLIESFGYIPALGLHNVTALHYKEILFDISFIKSLAYSLYIALSSALISTILGVMIAYNLMQSKNRFWKNLSAKILQIGLILPYLYIAFLTFLLLSKTGIISRIFINLSLIDSLEDFPRLIFDQFGIGIIFVYVIKGTPFVALFVFNVMGSISKKYHDVAISLGANKKDILKKIYLPLASNAIVWTSSILFVYDLGAFEVPYLLGTNRYITLSSKLYSHYINPHISEIPSAMAMNIILLVIGILSLIAYAMILKRLLKGE